MCFCIGRADNVSGVHTCIHYKTHLHIRSAKAKIALKDMITISDHELGAEELEEGVKYTIFTKIYQEIHILFTKLIY